MELHLKNIGKIGSASVEINGITVIAGENNTGKSTVGRALFAVFNSFYNIQKQVESERIQSVGNLLDFLYYRQSNTRRTINTYEMAKTIVSNPDRYGSSDRLIRKDVVSMFQQYGCNVEGRSTNEIISQIKDTLRVSNETFLQSVLNKRLDAEFYGQIENIFTEQDGEIELKIKEYRLAVSLKDNLVSQVRNQDGITLRTEAIYIDDPFVLDEASLGPYSYRMEGRYTDHRIHLQNKLYLVQSEGDLFNEIIVKDKFQNIYDKISSVCSGDVVRNRRTGLGYQRTDSDKILDVKNLSTGLKTFAILKTLLMNGAIQYNGTIILDEPEIHLHPEWQLLLAELVVLMQKEFKIHVLLNTHSPYFLRAIQVYSAKYEAEDNCKYYLSEMAEDYVTISDVSDCIDQIYAKLSHPLQKLEDQRWQDD